MINASENAVIIPKTFQLYAMYDVAKVSWKLYKMMTHWKPFLWINFNQHKRFQRIWIFDSRIFQLNVRFKMVYLICVFSLHISHSIFYIQYMLWKYPHQCCCLIFWICVLLWKRIRCDIHSLTHTIIYLFMPITY